MRLVNTVFYVVSGHEAIVSYIQVSNLNDNDDGEKSLFTIGNKNSQTNHAFIQEMMDKLKMLSDGTSNASDMQVTVEYHTLGMLSLADLNDKRFNMNEKNKGANVPVHIVA